MGLSNKGSDRDGRGKGPGSGPVPDEGSTENGDETGSGVDWICCRTTSSNEVSTFVTV